MQDLLRLGTLTSLDVVLADILRRISARGLGPPRAFAQFAGQIMVDHPELHALVLPGGTVLPGDLILETETLAAHGIATIAVLGDLAVAGRIINESSDDGGFLIIDGDLKAQQIEKGGAHFIVLGSITTDGLILCEEEYGAFLVGGNLTAPAIITCEQDINVAGTITGRLIQSGQDDIREQLVAEAFEDPDDTSEREVAAGRIRERLAAGLQVLR
jgi:hypothetical protein